MEIECSSESSQKHPRFTSTLSSCVYLCLQSDLFLWGFQTKILYARGGIQLFYPKSVLHVPPILLYLITLMVLGGKCKMNLLLCLCLHSSAISSVFLRVLSMWEKLPTLFILPWFQVCRFFPYLFAPFFFSWSIHHIPHLWTDHFWFHFHFIVISLLSFNSNDRIT